MAVMLNERNNYFENFFKLNKLYDIIWHVLERIVNKMEIINYILRKNHHVNH